MRLRWLWLIVLVLVVPRPLLAAAPVYEGLFTSPGLCSPRGIDLSPSGEVLVGSDCQADHIERFTPDGTVAGTWALTGLLGSPNGVAVDGSGNVYVAEYDGGRIWRFTSSGVLLPKWGAFYTPVDVAADGSGNVYVLEAGLQRVQKLSSTGTQLAVIGTGGSGPGQFQDPSGIGLDEGGRLYVTDYMRKRILRFKTDGSFDMEFATPVAPTDVAVGPDGNIYVITFDINGNYSQVRQFSPTGQLLLEFGAPTGMDGAFRILITPAGKIYITVQRPNSVAKFQIDMSTPAVPSTFGRVKALYR